MSYQSGSQALFVGFEVVTGMVNGKSGSFTLQHNEKLENGVAISSFVNVPGSGTGELANIEGTGPIKSGEAGKASYEISINT